MCDTVDYKVKLGKPKVIVDLEGLAELNSITSRMIEQGRIETCFAHNFFEYSIPATQDEKDDYEVSAQILQGDIKAFAEKWRASE